MATGKVTAAHKKRRRRVEFLDFMNDIVAAYADWLATSRVPKLFVKAEPGLLIAGGENLDFARKLPAQTEVTIAGVHYVQEDSPDEIGRAIAGWMGAIG